jgi:hypothetical protein
MLGSKMWPVRRADNLATNCNLNVYTITSHDSIGLHGDLVLAVLVMVNSRAPSLWSSGQSSWLQIRRPGLDSRHYQKKQ